MAKGEGRGSAMLMTDRESHLKVENLLIELERPANLQDFDLVEREEESLASFDGAIDLGDKDSLGLKHRRKAVNVWAVSAASLYACS